MSTMSKQNSSKTGFQNGVHKSENTDNSELLALNQCLLDSIVRSDYDTYNRLVAGDLTCFEPEASDNLVEGKSFHKFYFDLPTSKEWGKPWVETNVTMCSPHVRRMGKDVAVLSYNRINQSFVDGKVVTTKSCETRVWERRNFKWVNVHFHRS